MIRTLLPNTARMIKSRKENRDDTQHSHWEKKNACETFVTKPKGKTSLALGILQRITYARS